QRYPAGRGLQQLGLLGDGKAGRHCLSAHPHSRSGRKTHASSWAQPLTLRLPLRQAAMWMSSSRTHESSYLAYDSFSSRTKRDLLLCVARRTAVTLTWDAPLSKAQCPGLSVSRIEPFGGFLSQFCLSSRRSLGHSLLLGQRSRLHFFSYHIRSLFHQDYGNPPTEFARHRDNGDPGSDVARMGFSHRAEKISKLTVLADG